MEQKWSGGEFFCLDYIHESNQRDEMRNWSSIIHKCLGPEVSLSREAASEIRSSQY
jgi:hypothetical protein